MSNLVRIKWQRERWGRVATTLPARTAYQELDRLGGEELGQLYLDLAFLDQPALREGERGNLLQLVYLVGRRRYGDFFLGIVARQFVAGMGVTQ